MAKQNKINKKRARRRYRAGQKAERLDMRQGGRVAFQRGGLRGREPVEEEQKEQELGVEINIPDRLPGVPIPPVTPTTPTTPAPLPVTPVVPDPGIVPFVPETPETPEPIISQKSIEVPTVVGERQK